MNAQSGDRFALVCIPYLSNNYVAQIYHLHVHHRNQLMYSGAFSLQQWILTAIHFITLLPH